MCVKACAQQPTAFENVHEAFLVFSGTFLKSSQLKKSLSSFVWRSLEFLKDKAQTIRIRRTLLWARDMSSRAQYHVRLI